MIENTYEFLKKIDLNKTMSNNRKELAMRVNLTAGTNNLIS
jgi:hypothetical protein